MNKLDKINKKHGHENKKINWFPILDSGNKIWRKKIHIQNKIKYDEEWNIREWSKHLDYFMDICNKEQDDDSVDNLLKFVGQKPELNEV